MSTSGPTPLEQPEPRNPDQTQELLRFLREENDANRTAVREDADANRKLLLDTVRIASIPLAVLILIAGWFGFKSISDLKAALESEARQSTQAEITRMQSEIRTRLDAQFQTSELRKIVKEAAIESTQTATEPLIKVEVAKQVGSRVNAEKPAIAAAVTQQTQLAAKQMAPQIDSLVRNSVDAKISTSVEPVIQRIKEQGDLQLWITRVNTDDALAYDLLAQWTNPIEPSTQTLIRGALRTVMSAHNTAVYSSRFLPEPQNKEQLIADLSMDEPYVRQAALDTLDREHELTPTSASRFDVLPRVVEVMQRDPSIAVRCAAYRVFSHLVTQRFQCMDYGALAWWESNKQNFPATH